MKYVSIDLETTGINPMYCQVLEIGAVAQELGGEELGRFHAIIEHEELRGTPFALNLNQRLVQAIVEGEAQGGETAWQEFYDWLMQYQSVESKDRVVAAGKNFSGFDLPFIIEAADWFEVYELKNAFFRRVLDPAILFMRPDDVLPPDQATCLERAGMENTVTHNAVDDAVQVRDLIEYSFNWERTTDAADEERETVGA